MIRLFCDKCGEECEAPDIVLGQYVSMTRIFGRDMFPTKYYCKACYAEYERQVDIFEKDIAEKETWLRDAKKRLEDFEDSWSEKE